MVAGVSVKTIPAEPGDSCHVCGNTEPALFVTDGDYGGCSRRCYQQDLKRRDDVDRYDGFDE